jgi:dCMP deaminase
MRPSFESIYMQLALNLSQRSTCLRLKVGCVITDPAYKYVYSVGYNGNAAGLPNHCDVEGEAAVGNCGCIHAEENAVIHCCQHYSVPKIVFTTHLPCVMCAKRLLNLGGVTTVFYRSDYRKHDSLDLLLSKNVRVKQLLDENPLTALPPLMSTSEMRDLIISCEKGEQNCYRCPAFICADNLHPSNPFRIRSKNG